MRCGGWGWARREAVGGGVCVMLARGGSWDGFEMLVPHF